MSEPTDYISDLTTAPIFDDAIYLSEALGASESQSEDDLDARLVSTARESGIDDPYRLLCPDTHDTATSLSTLTVASGSRSSVSIHSRETQSTSITSHPSRTSKDNPYMDSMPALRTLPPPLPPSRGSSCFERYDTVLDRFRPTSVRHTPSSSIFSGTAVMSRSCAPPTSTPQKLKRKSGLFSMFKKDTRTCASRSHHGHHANPLNPRLACGHSLSKYAIRVHIQEALESVERFAPSCCGTPLPRSVLETVLTKEETDNVTAAPVEFPLFSSLRDSGYSEDGLCSVDLSQALSKLSHSNGSFVTAPDSPSQALILADKELLEMAFADKAFTTLRAQQKEQFQRVSIFESNQRTSLAAYHQWALKRLLSKLEENKVESMKQHAIVLERLDESQIVAEHDLRESHAQETQNVATALKYMEAYCSGSKLTNPDTAHTITEEDRNKLARQYVIQKKLPAKHESAINVLRARQEMNVKTKMQKQQAELEQLTTNYGMEKQAEEWQYMQDSDRLEVLIEARRRRVIHRWDLKFEIWRRGWESQHKTTLNGRLPHEEWPRNAHVNGPLDSSGLLALYSQGMA
ncbi:hypothetical protein K504DRAFT_462933 [Pleomassaria siparia CBS 279.74]|uniref:Uncharacterized protein n=1 Tax=Pleomassaria siparia CBS 279.74 TaxID=1314801 RepID=A0A6G1JU67_9PLEO|nr:hypothetical protein K504DRAFT_462933 [Pleomassaria siparia CBS 279.74]